MKYLLAVVFFLSTYCLYGQNNFQEKVTNSLDSFNYLAPRETAYLQTNMSIYQAGEVILFKAFVTLNGTPTPLSKVVYAVLSDANGKVIEKQMLKLENSSAHGQMTVSTKWPTGYYTLKCYTMWMLNFPESIFETHLTLVNASISDDTPVKKSKEYTDVNFLPEGGCLIAGVENRVAFKAERNLLPLQIVGKVKDSKGNVVATISSEHDGMGAFSFIPIANENYIATVDFLNSKTNTYNLPNALEEGIALKVDNAAKIYVNVKRGNKNKELFNELYIVAKQGSQITYFNKLNIDEGLDAAAITKKALKPGIMQVTIFSKDGIPLAERLVFIENYEIPKPTMLTINKKARQKNTISIPSEGFTNLDAYINIGYSSPAESGTNILNYLLLTKDIKGSIFNPSQYFADKSTETLHKLDLLMLTNGWRGYKWKDILAMKYPELHYPFEQSMSLSGTAYGAGEKIPLSGGKINFIIKGEDSTSAISETTINEKGFFVLDHLDFGSKATIGYQATAKNNANAYATAKINPTYIDTVSKLTPMAYTIFEADSAIAKVNNQLNPKLKAKTLENVIIKSRRRAALDSMKATYVSEAFQTSDQTLIKDEINYFDMWQYLRRNIPGIEINNTDSGFKVYFSRYSGSNFFASEEAVERTQVQFFLNEISVSNEVVEMLNPEDVSIVLVYKGITGIPLGAFQGAISIYTVKGKTGRDFRDKGFDIITKRGYNVPLETYNIDYSKINSDSIPKDKDTRNTIYWSPKIKFMDGKAVIDYYASDFTNEQAPIFIRIEGIDEKGKIYYYESKY